MYLPEVAFHETKTLEEASLLLQRFGDASRVMAGGTDLLVDLKAGRVSTDHVISINRIPELRGVRIDDGILSIGALTTITQLDRDPEVRKRFPAINDATKSMAVRQIRNMATVGGNLASAVSCADLPPILTALSASVLIWSPTGERTVPIETFFRGVRDTVVGHHELIKAILVPPPPPPPRFGAAYARFGLREGNAIAVASVAASLTFDVDGTITDARVVLGAVAPTPLMVTEAADALCGRRLNEESKGKAAELAVSAAKPISDVRGTADFRRRLIHVLTGRALESAHHRAMGAQA